MAATAISGLTALTAPAVADQLIVVDDSAGDNKSLALSHLALLGTANVFTAAQTIPAIVTASGALTVTPAAGSGVNIVLSTTGDFVVNTNQFVVDTSTGFSGFGTTIPGQLVDVAGGGTQRIRISDTRSISWSGGEEHGAIEFYSLDGSSPGPQTIASIRSYQAAGTVGATSDLAFFTAPSLGAEAERLRITNAGGVLIGTATDSGGKLQIDQSSTTGAIPVLRLDQADTSDEFIEFVSTVGAGLAIDTAAIGTYYGKVRVSVAGVGNKFIALYNT